MNHTASGPHSNVVAIIPARYGSTRLPGKALLKIAGREMILWVVDRALQAENVGRAIVATDDDRIIDCVRGAGFEAMMTRDDHASGSDRLAEVAATLDDVDVVVNVQGDEPLVSPATIERAVDELLNADEADIVTTSERMTDVEEVLSDSVVKVVVDKGGRALYFSRSPIPYPRESVRQYGSLRDALNGDKELLNSFRKHTGLYAYRLGFLLEYATWPSSELELAESLEQLRALERGAVIKVVDAAAPSIGVDTEDDLNRVRAIMEAANAK